MGRGLAVGVCACVLALAAASGCGGSSASSTGAGLPTGETLPDGGNGVPMRTRVGATEHELDLVGPREYAPAGVVAPFRAATGCDVQVTPAASSRELLEMFRTGGYDGVVAPSEVSARLIASHDVAPIDTSLIPDFDDLSAKLQSPQANTLDGVHYGISYLWGANPLLYRTDLVTPAPQSWDVVFDGVSYPGRVTAPDTPMYIADAALYLKSAQPSLDISDPYELTRPQFDAAVQLLQQQRAQISSYWSSSAGLVRDFTTGAVVLGQAGEQPYGSLETAGVPVATVVPDEGVTGWIESWMMSSQALHPDCMLKWMAYTATPIVQAAVAHSTDSAPANPAACAVLDRAPAGYCSTQPGTEPSYLDSVSFAKAPLTTCDNGKSECVGYPEWVRAWESIAG